MINQKEFEALRLEDVVPEAAAYNATEALFDLEYLGGQYETCEVPGVAFGYGEATPEQLAYLELMLLDDDGAEASRKYTAHIASSIDLPFKLGASLGDAANLLGNLMPLDENDAPLFLEISAGPFKYELTLDNAGAVKRVEIQNLNVIAKNCIDDASDYDSDYDASDHESFTRDDSVPCPKCGKPLRTAQARQCFHCGADWH